MSTRTISSAAILTILALVLADDVRRCDSSPTAGLPAPPSGRTFVSSSDGEESGSSGHEKRTTYSASVSGSGEGELTSNDILAGNPDVLSPEEANELLSALLAELDGGGRRGAPFDGRHSSDGRGISGDDQPSQPEDGAGEGRPEKWEPADVHGSILSLLQTVGVGKYPSVAGSSSTAEIQQLAHQLQQSDTTTSTTTTTTATPTTVSGQTNTEPDVDDDDDAVTFDVATAWPTPDTFAKPEYPFDPQRYPNPPIFLDVPVTTTVPPTLDSVPVRSPTTTPTPTTTTTTTTTTTAMPTPTTTTSPVPVTSTNKSTTAATTSDEGDKSNKTASAFPTPTGNATSVAETTTRKPVPVVELTTQQPAPAAMSAADTSSTVPTTTSAPTDDPPYPWPTPDSFAKPHYPGDGCGGVLSLEEAYAAGITVHPELLPLIRQKRGPRNYFVPGVGPSPSTRSAELRQHGSSRRSADVHDGRGGFAAAGVRFRPHTASLFGGGGGGDGDDDGRGRHRGYFEDLRRRRPARARDEHESVFVRDGGGGGRRRDGIPDKDELTPEEYRRQVEMYRRNKLLQVLTPPGGTGAGEFVVGGGGGGGERGPPPEDVADRFAASFHHLEIPAANLQKITLTVTPTASTFPSAPSPTSAPSSEKADRRNPIEWETIIHAGSSGSRDDPQNWNNNRNRGGGLSRLAAFADSFRRQQQEEEQQQQVTATATDGKTTDREESRRKFNFGKDDTAGKRDTFSSNTGGDERDGNILRHRLEQQFHVTSSIHDSHNPADSNNNNLRRRGTSPSPPGDADVASPVTAATFLGHQEHRHHQHQPPVRADGSGARQRPDWFTSGQHGNKHQQLQVTKNGVGFGEAIPADADTQQTAAAEEAHLDNIRHLLIEDLREIMNAAGNLSDATNVEMLTQIGLPIRGYKSDDATTTVRDYTASDSWGDIDGRSIHGTSGNNQAHPSSDFNSVYRPVRPSLTTSSISPGSPSSSFDRPLRPQVITIGLTPVRPAQRPTGSSSSSSSTSNNGNGLVSHLDVKPIRPLGGTINRPTLSLRPVTVASPGISIGQRPGSTGTTSSSLAPQQPSSGATTGTNGFRPSAAVVPGATPTTPWVVPSGAGGTTIALPSDFDGEKRLNKLDFFFDSLNIANEECRQRVLCELAKHELAMTPLSSVFLDEIRYYKGLEAVARGLEITTQGKRLLGYMESAYKGRERQFQCNHREYPNCPRAMEDLVNMDAVLVWKEVSKWLTIKVAARKERGTSRYQEVDLDHTRSSS